MCCCAPTVELLVASWLADVHAQNEALAAKDVELKQASAAATMIIKTSMRIQLSTTPFAQIMTRASSQ